MTSADQSAKLQAAWMPLARAVFLVSAIVAAAALIADQRGEIATSLGLIDPAGLIVPSILAFGHVASSFLAWLVLVPGKPHAISPGEAARIFFLGQVGKYLPGGVWQFVAAAELGRDAGLSRRTTIASFLFALAASISAGAAIALATAPAIVVDAPLPGMWLVLALLPVGALLLPPVQQGVGRLGKLQQVPGSRRLAGSAAWSLVTWLLAGAQLYFLARGLDIAIDPSSVFALAGIYACAWIVGFVVMIAPAGLGAREATLIALLSIKMPLAEATIIALLSRVLTTLADLAAAGLTLLVTRGSGAQARP